MTSRPIRYGLLSLVGLTVLSWTSPLLAQLRPFPDVGPLQKPLVKLIGYVDAPPPETTSYPALTLGLPGDERATF